MILAAVSSYKWQRPIIKINENDNENDEEDEEFLAEQQQANLFLEDQASSIGIYAFFFSFYNVQDLNQCFFFNLKPCQPY